LAALCTPRALRILLSTLSLLQIAKRQAVVNPEDTFFSVKRFIGSKFQEVKAESTQVPYRVKEDSSGNVKLTSNNANKDFAPEEISAQVLRKLVDDAGETLQCRAVAVTCGRGCILVITHV
jgi:molecular chaperone DnaK (HSP70)